MPATHSHRRPQRVPVFRNDNWPPRPPSLPAPSFLASPDDELLRGLPTPSFVKPQLPSKAVIAASAVPLADWFADVVWALYLGPTHTPGGTNAGLAGADKAPQQLTAFVHAVLSQTLASPQCAALGLYYLVRLPVRLASPGALRIAGPLWNVARDADGHTCYVSVPDRDRTARAAFVAELYGPGAEDVPYRLAALALMLGNKWLDDHTFTNKTWHEVTHLDLARLTALEQRALDCFGYSLGVPNDDWRAWLGVLKEGAQNAHAAAYNPTSALAIQVMERLEHEHEVLLGGVGAGMERHQVDMDELEMQQVEIDIDLDDGGPVPDELRRPVKVRLGAGGRWNDDWKKDDDEWESALRAAGGENWLMGIVDEDRYAEDRAFEWDRARDPPVRARGQLDPVQRPVKKGVKNVPRVELYDARLPVYDPHFGYPPYYPAEAVPRDYEPFDEPYDCYGSYVPRQLPVWASRVY